MVDYLNGPGDLKVGETAVYQAEISGQTALETDFLSGKFGQRAFAIAVYDASVSKVVDILKWTDWEGADEVGAGSLEIVFGEPGNYMIFAVLIEALQEWNPNERIWDVSKGWTLIGNKANLVRVVPDITQPVMLPFPSITDIIGNQ